MLFALYQNARWNVLLVVAVFGACLDVSATPINPNLQPASLQSGAVVPHEEVAESQVTEPTSPQIQISIRAVYAQIPLQEGEARSDTALFDERLADIRTKLELLPFSNFRLISEESEAIHLREKSTVRLSNGQRLCLRAVDSSDQNVTLWLRWSDINGAILLDTRMNFAKGETMVAGVESDEENAAVVLAVKAS